MSFIIVDQTKFNMTKMAASYPNYELSISHGFTNTSFVSQHQQIQPQQHQHRQLGYVIKKARENTPKQLRQRELSSFITSKAKTPASSTNSETTASVRNSAVIGKSYISIPKNYFVPLHIDCSVEYELPNQPKPPAGKRFEPLLMIHPCYFRKMESQRRSPFINNMPNSSRNGAAMFVGVTLVSHETNTSTSFRTHQHHYNTRQNFASQYVPIINTNEQNQFKKLTNRQEHKPQLNLPPMLQQTLYPEINMQFVDDSSTPIGQNATDLVNRINHHTFFSSIVQLKNQSNQEDLVQNSSPASEQWDQLATTKSSRADQNPTNLNSAFINNLGDRAECSIVSSSKLGKRDAMISGSGGYSNNSLSVSNISLRVQMNKTIGNNISASSDLREKKKTNNDRSKSTLISTCLLETTKLHWNAKTNIKPSSLMVNQSPMSTVPSNFQAGPDISPHHHDYKRIIDNNTFYTNNETTSSEKFRHFLRSRRVYPYSTGTQSSQSDILALSSKSTLTARGDLEVLPKFPAAKSGVAAISALTSFQQNIQQCVIKLE